MPDSSRHPIAHNRGRTGSQGSASTSGSGENRGFAFMDDDRQREIAAEGGRGAHRSGDAHASGSEEARDAGRKNGQGSSINGESGNRSDQVSSGGGDRSGQAGRGGSADDSEE